MIEYQFSPVYFGNFPPKFLELTSVSYSSFLNKFGTTESGLTKEEIYKFMPAVVNITPDEPGFLAAVTTYFENFTVKLNSKGKKLNVELNSDGTPKNIIDYLTYKIALADNIVAKEQDIAQADGKIFSFTLLSLQELKEKTETNYNLIKQATIAYTALSQLEPSRLRVLKSIVLLGRVKLDLGIDEVNSADRITTEISLKKLLDLDPQFLLDCYKDLSTITLKAYIQLMLDLNIVRLEGDAVYLKDVKIASNSTNLYSVLKNDNNLYSKLISALRKEQHTNNILKEEALNEVV